MYIHEIFPLQNWDYTCFVSQFCHFIWLILCHYGTIMTHANMVKLHDTESLSPLKTWFFIPVCWFKPIFYWKCSCKMTPPALPSHYKCPSRVPCSSCSSSCSPLVFTQAAPFPLVPSSCSSLMLQLSALSQGSSFLSTLSTCTQMRLSPPDRHSHLQCFFEYQRLFPFSLSFI